MASATLDRQFANYDVDDLCFLSKHAQLQAQAAQSKMAAQTRMATRMVAAPRRGSVTGRRSSVRRGALTGGERRGSMPGGERRGSLAGVVSASKFVNNFRAATAAPRLQQRRNALTTDSIRLVSRRGAISEASGLLAHLDATNQEAETLKVTRRFLEETPSSSEASGRLRPTSADHGRGRRQSAAIDWELIRRNINVMPTSPAKVAEDEL